MVDVSRTIPVEENAMNTRTHVTVVPTPNFSAPQTNGVHDSLLGYVDRDDTTASNERVMMRAPLSNRTRIVREQLVRIEDANGTRTGFLGRVVAGPFFPRSSPRSGDSVHDSQPGAAIYAEVEIQGELVDGSPRDSKSRPTPGAAVRELSNQEVADLLGFSGDMLLGTVSGQENLSVQLRSNDKGVLPRNLGIFGTVGSGKSNTAQVLIEEASAAGWSVIVLDVESEYTDMDAPTTEVRLTGKLARFGRWAAGLTDFQVFHPASCPSERSTSEPFTLRLADFDTSVIAEILETTVGERNALIDCVEHFEQRARSKMTTTASEELLPLLDPTPQAKLPFSVRCLKDRAGERSPRSSEFYDYTGLSAKLTWLVNSGTFDLPNLRSVDTERLLAPGRVSVFDVSAANDIVKNLVTADLLRKLFAYKIAKPESPPTLLVIEEAHSFISREKVQTMQATLQMLRNVARRGRKRWLSLAFVSQQPGHLPPEIFELCNTRIVHTLRSMHNLEALMSTAGDVGRDLWARCPLLGPGEAVLTSPQLKRPVVISVRPASSCRKFVR
jgi:DNA helicase HerA-like ATPase